MGGYVPSSSWFIREKIKNPIENRDYVAKKKKYAKEKSRKQPQLRP